MLDRCKGWVVVPGRGAFLAVLRAHCRFWFPSEVFGLFQPIIFDSFARREVYFFLCSQRSTDTRCSSMWNRGHDSVLSASSLSLCILFSRERR